MVLMLTVSGFLARTGALPLCTLFFHWNLLQVCAFATATAITVSCSELGLGDGRALTVGSLEWVWSFPPVFLLRFQSSWIVSLQAFFLKILTGR